jgi:uncharacterized protein (TIGR02594 family)
MSCQQINTLMRNLFIAPAFALVTACSADELNDDKTRIHTSTLTHKAYHYYGLDEVRDRELIREIMGVDPVSTEWCAAFVNMVLLENDLPQSSEYNDYPLMARSFLFWGEEVRDNPMQGDVLIFKRGTSGWQGHVGFYVNRRVLNGEVYYYVLGGNQSDKVSIEAYPASKLLGIRRLNTDV